MDDARIAQFKKMTEADPDNELGHLSLGKAYLDAGQAREAIGPLQRAISLAPTNSKAYHLLAMAQKEVGDRAGAIATLKKGFDVANSRGDLMPRNQMAVMLKGFGEPVPQMADAPAAGATTAAAGEGQVKCTRCGEVRPKMPERPFKGPLGEQVWANVCGPCWQQWIPMGTKVINELRLDFADPRAAEAYDLHMKEFLGLH